MGTNGANMTTFGLRTGCMLSNGYENPILQDLIGKIGYTDEDLKWDAKHPFEIINRYRIVEELMGLCPILRRFNCQV